MKREEAERRSESLFFCDRDSFLLRAPVLRHGMPRRSLKDCHVAALLAMTQNWNVFIWITNVLHFLRLFFVRYCSAPFFKCFIPEIAPFSRKTHQICHCEEGAILAPDAAFFDGTICHPGTNYGCAGRNRTLKGRERKRNEAANPLFCNRAFFLFRAPVLRHGMPRRSLKDCHVAALLAMTQNWNVFVWKTDVFCFMRSFFARCCSAPFFKRFVPEIVSFSRKTHQICHCEEGACARRGNL